MPQSADSRVFLGMAAIVASPEMRKLLAVVERAAQTQASVLIQGESGSGKELIARAVHHYSLRCNKPWVDVSCAALPDSLVESELFGYEKGAFSSADAPKPGLFELAKGGTLFLDEIGELEPRMQVKLLRVLDGVPYYRLGGVKKITVDVRIIAATNQNLQDMISTGRFRGDLYHRLEQISLRVPPLRERLDDIVPLAEYFLKQSRPTAFFSGDACSMLRAYNWPGNIRQLRNVVTKAAVLASADEMRARDLTIEVATQPVHAGDIGADQPDTSNLHAIERRAILKVLEQTQGHQQKAADLLGISSRTLSRKLRTYENGAPRRSYAS